METKHLLAVGHSNDRIYWLWGQKIVSLLTEGQSENSLSRKVFSKLFSNVNERIEGNDLCRVVSFFKLMFWSFQTQFLT